MKLNYKIYGEGQPLVILHGLFGCLDNWQLHAKKLSEYFQVIAVDQRNHGHSPWSDDFSYDLLADDLIGLLQDLNLSTIHLLGHSMGGKTALRFAQKYPNALQKLIIADIGLKGYPPHHGEIFTAIRAVDLTPPCSRAKVESDLSKYIDSSGIRQFLMKNLYWEKPELLAWRMNIDVLEREQNKIIGELPKDQINTQTLFIRGAQSNYILDEDWNDISDQVPDSDLVTIENAGHWVHAEAPVEFMNVVLEFLIR
jgi:esterase